MMTVALDAMGGDFGPRITVPAAVQALSCLPLLKIILIGDESRITNELLRLGIKPSERLIVHPCSYWISNDEKPSHALRSYQDSSMKIALDLVATKKAQACISAGNTGALMALAKRQLGLISGIDRPALVSQLPTTSSTDVWMLDLGANTNCSANLLSQFAVMGHALAQTQLQRRPKIALLNIGEEAHKGKSEIKSCAKLLKEIPALDYAGFIEGDKIFSGIVDVIVCDGFAGNVCLKSSEGVAHLFKDKLKKQIKPGVVGFLKKWLLKDLFKQFESMNPEQYNGASLLGLQHIVIKSHGQADIDAMTRAIIRAADEIEVALPQKITQYVEKILPKR